MAEARITRKPETPEQLQAIMDRYEEKLLKYSASILHDGDRAYDAVQEVFLKLWNTGRLGESRNGLASWLFTVCRNRCLDMVRKDSRMTRLNEQIENSRPDEGVTPPAAAEQHETTGQLATAIADLPAGQQEVLRLKFQNDFTYRQIAEITGQTVANVGFKLHCGLKKIREKLSAAGLTGRD